MTHVGNQSQPLLSFRDALASPFSAYIAIEKSTNVDLDTTLTKTLLDYKRGRRHQAIKRFENLVASLGFNTKVPLIQQAEKLDENTACLLIFELLFILKKNGELSDEQLWQYVDSVAFFDPDDAICHGVIYNLMLVFFVRNGDLAAAFRLAKMALSTYQRCGSVYLQLFIHLHIAYIHTYAGRLTDAAIALDDAQEKLLACGRPVCESAMIEITRHWIRAEAETVLPSVKELLVLGERLTEGEFWPEILLVLTALQLRAEMAEGHPHLLEQLSINEFTLRNCGLQSLLPAVQLLRQECQPEGLANQQRPPLNLPEQQIVLLLPTVATWRQNVGEIPDSPPKLKRVLAVHEMHLARLWRERGRFDLVMTHFIAAMEIIAEHGFIGLQASEAEFIAAIAQECRKRGRFVEKARGWLNQIAALAPHNAGPHHEEVFGLTPTELGVLQRLALSTSNKALGLELGVSESTVKYHLKNIYRKLGVHKRRAAIDLARAKGII